MTNEEKAKELIIQLREEAIVQDIEFDENSAFTGAFIMAEWKDKNPSVEIVKEVLKADDEICYKCTLADPDYDFKSNDEYYYAVAKRAAELLNKK